MPNETAQTNRGLPSTLEFFKRTAQYASSARSRFSIDAPPIWFKNIIGNKQSNSNIITSKEIELLDIGFTILKEGILAKSIALPASTLITDQGFSYGGPTRKHPLVQQFNNIDVDFLLMGRSLDEAKALYFTFSFWHEIVAGPRNISRKESTRSDSTAFAVEFYDNYTTEATASISTPIVDNSVLGSQKELSSPEVVKIHYTELYPISIGSIFASWESQDMPISLPIQFCYYYAKTLID
jgi:hypothetical protein